VPATIVGRRGAGTAYRSLSVRVEPSNGRLVAIPERASGLRYLRRIPDAIRYLRSVIGDDVLPASGLPAGARLASPPVEVSSYNAGTPTGSLNVTVPQGGRGRTELTIGFAYSGFGCGGDPVPVDVGASQGNMTSHRSVHQWHQTPEVIWPAKPNEMSARFSVAGHFDLTDLVAIAADLDAARKR
jgi:hypothetical protein